MCRPDYEVRKKLIENYTEKGYRPAIGVFDSTFNWRGGFKKFFKDTLEQVKVTFLPIVGEHIRPSRKYYKEHLKLGVGESISVKSIWDYLEDQDLLHPKADPSMFIIPTLNYADAERLKEVIKANIFIFTPEEKQALEMKKFEKVLEKMKK